jgi:hypothetical protein
MGRRQRAACEKERTLDYRIFLKPRKNKGRVFVPGNLRFTFLWNENGLKMNTFIGVTDNVVCLSLLAARNRCGELLAAERESPV